MRAEPRSKMGEAKISTKKLNLYYGTNHALKEIDMDIRANAVGYEKMTALHIQKRQGV